ncbi:MAG: ABC transporter permease subunit [Candidatus Delongbacteria bacterium]|nr:ABC transporter permease subunit [Candidatus Delongbacteria bacterium]MBN2836234.1 ABC transporter permease subunit [Candidatus Delongbacteria bacterium]
MLLELIKKDLKISLKDLKFQIFGTIIVILFIISTISSINILETSLKNYESNISIYTANTTSISKSMLSMTSGNHVYYQKPELSNIIYSDNKFPDKISTSITNFMPYASNGTSSDIQLSWIFIIGVVCSFAFLVFAFDSLSKEKKDGTLRLLTIGTKSRITILFSKFLTILLIFSGIVLTAIIVSLLYIAIYYGDMINDFIVPALFFYIISIVYISIFILLGLIISMSKKTDAGLIRSLVFWVFLVIVIPLSAELIGTKLVPIKTSAKYDKESSDAYNKEFNEWVSKYDNENGNHVRGNGYLEDGLRPAAYYASREKMAVKYVERFSDYEHQYNIISYISYLSPFSIYQTIMERILDKGITKFNNEINQFSSFRQDIENEMKNADKLDETSLHFFYRGAYGDAPVVSGKGLYPFSNKEFPKPEKLVFKYRQSGISERITNAFYFILGFVGVLVILISYTALRFKRFDVR